LWIVVNSAIQAAYAAANSGDILKMQAVKMTGNLLFGHNVTVTLEGGFSGCALDARDGSTVTVIDGSLTITKGTVVMDDVEITSQ
jgi:hypothetical protein